MKFAARNNYKLFCSHLSSREKTIISWRVGLISQKAAELRLSCDSEQLHRYKKNLRTKMEEEPGRVRMLEFGTTALLAMYFGGITRHQLNVATGWSGSERELQDAALKKGLTAYLYSDN